MFTLEAKYVEDMDNGHDENFFQKYPKFLPCAVLLDTVRLFFLKKNSGLCAEFLSNLGKIRHWESKFESVKLNVKSRRENCLCVY